MSDDGERSRPAAALLAHSVDLFRLTLRLFPLPFRARYAPEMEQLFRAWCHDQLRRRGPRGLVHVWRSTLADVAGAAWREHAAARAAARAERCRTDAHRAGSDGPGPRDTGDSMTSLMQDVRYAFRTLRKSPGFVAVVVLSLALGIGANSLIYSVVDGVVFRPFAYPESGRLVMLGATYPKLGGERSFVETFAPADYTDAEQQSRTLERFFAFDLGNRNLSGGDRPERVFTAFIWGDPFRTIGFRPALGRGFTAEETTGAGPRVAVLSHRVWQTRFGGDSALVGRAIQVNGEPVTVVGIMPPALLLLGADLWLPMGVQPAVIPRSARQYAIVARLRPGATLGQANAELATIAARTERSHAKEREEYAGWRLEAAPMAEALVGEFRPAAVVLLGAVALVLLIACANIASLMLARAATRQREIAVRRALGAGRLRIARQLLSESVLLALAGGALGLLVAYGLIGPTLSLFPAQITDAGVGASIDTRVVGYTFLLATLSGLVFGVAPAVQGARTDGSHWLAAEGQRHTIGGRGRRLRHALVVAELALALVLLAGAGLLGRSFARLRGIDPGFDTRNVLTMRLSLPREKYAERAVGPFFEELAVRLVALPGVRGAAASTQFAPGNGFTTRVGLEGDRGSGSEAVRTTDITNVTTGFFRALGYALKGGRDFGAQDSESSPPVVVLNETAARRFFPGQSAIGRRVRIGEEPAARWAEVVGVVGDVRNRGLDAATAPELFVPVRQQAAGFNNQLFLLVRTAGAPASALPAVRRTIATLDPDQPVYMIRSLEGAFGESISERRLAMLLLAIFAGLALALASIGVYGIMSYMVSERTHEIGIRMALGARRGDVLGMVLRQSAALAVVGLALGMAGALALSRALSSLVFGISATDPGTLAGVAVLLLGVTALAALLPARRASRVSPAEAMRAG
ncbi:MAG TPA: ABC transporter permease [Gemmatimonadaceae bacterium]|nr:ABC transporter permease [Gemmatimonadaceae bacterium]